MRLAALIAALVVVAGGAWLLRSNGILLGRDGDGPLELLSSGFTAAPLKPGEVTENVDLVRSDGAVEVESVRPRRISPGLELLGPLLHEDSVPPAMEAPSEWPPDRSRPVGGSRVSGERSVGYGLRADEPGFYFLVGLRYRYGKGIRRFDELDRTSMCLHVSPRARRQHCPEPDRIAGFEGLAEIGGPSDYGDAELSEEEGAVFRMRRGGTVDFVITISNLSDEDREVPRLELGRGGDPGYKDAVDPLPSDPPTPFTIPGGGHRQVRVRARVTDCDFYRDRQARVLEAIEAGDDDVELSVPVRIGGPCR